MVFGLIFDLQCCLLLFALPRTCPKGLGPVVRLLHFSTPTTPIAKAANLGRDASSRTWRWP